MTFHKSALALSMALTLASSVASAHIDLNNPPARFQDPLQDQKIGPCGAEGGRANVTDLVAGQTVELQWDETVQHDSYFRLAFLEDGDAFPNPEDFDAYCDPAESEWCIEDGILDDQIEGTFTYQWTVPEIECDNCTLQLIQVMYDDDGFQLNDLYFDCADVTVSIGGGTTAATTTSSGGDGGSTGDGGASGDGGSASGDGDGNGDGDGSGDGDGNGKGNGGASAVGATSTATGEPAEPTTFPADGGCTVTAAGVGAGSGALTLAAGIGILALGRRRRRA